MNVNALPHTLHMENLSPGEEVRLFLRRHVIIFFQKVTLFVLLGFVPVIVWVALYSQTTILDDTQGSVRIVIVFTTSLFYLFWLRHLFTMWIDYYLDVWIVTTQRIIHIDHDGLFNRKVSEQRLDRIQDITTEAHGFLQTTMKFGDIRVQTAAETEHFIFKDIKKPEQVAQEITRLQSLAMEKSTSYIEAQGIESKKQTISTPPQQL